MNEPLLDELLDVTTRAFATHTGIDRDVNDGLLAWCLDDIRDTFDPEASRFEAYSQAIHVVAQVMEDTATAMVVALETQRTRQPGELGDE